MAIVDIASMNRAKKLFNDMADVLIEDTLNKKKKYETLYNKANMLKNEINKLLIDFNQLCLENNIVLSKPIFEMNSYTELEDSVIDVKVDNNIVEKIKILLYKIKMRLDGIIELRTQMNQLDLYEGHSADMEDDTLDEHYIDMDEIRRKRGIDLEQDILNDLDINLDMYESSEDSEYYDYRLDGLATLKQIANEVYGNPSYWIHIYNYSDNSKKIYKVALDNYLSIKDVVENPELLKGIKIKIPKEIEFYSDEFNTSVLEKVA